MTNPELISIGEPLAEFNQTVPGGPFHMGFGGDTSNCVIAAARAGARTGYIARIGEDLFGDGLMERPDEGITGWAETYDWHTSASLATALQVMGRRLIGEDPRRIELFNERIWYGGRPGVPERMKVLAAIDMARWDIKAKWLGVPVYELLGGKFRDRIPLYWSHFATYRGGLAGDRRRRSRSPRTRSGRRARATSSPRATRCSRPTSSRRPGRGERADAARRTTTAASTDGRSTRRSSGSARSATWSGPDIGISVDVQFDYRMGGIVQLARALEPFNLYWLEVEISTRMPCWPRASRPRRACATARA